VQWSLRGKIMRRVGEDPSEQDEIEGKREKKNALRIKDLDLELTDITLKMQ
jgi:hypothetical protein